MLFQARCTGFSANAYAAYWDVGYSAGDENELALLLFYCLGLRASQYFRHQCSTGSSFRCRSVGVKSRIGGCGPLVWSF